MQWVALQKRRGALVGTLHMLLLANPLVALRVQFVRYDISPRVQATAIRVAEALAARDASVARMMAQLNEHAGALVHGFSRYPLGCILIAFWAWLFRRAWCNFRVYMQNCHAQHVLQYCINRTYFPLF